MSVDDLSPDEIDRRFNHWDENDSVSFCRNCGSFIPKQEPKNGRIEYVCGSCNRAILEYVG